VGLVSLWNFIRYNVVGGGDSALYGVEDASFYLRNGLNNFQFLVPLALLLPVAAALAGTSLCLPRSSGSAHVKPGRTNTGASGSVLRLLVCVAPVFVWGAAITALPHKEERFLYVVYPLICLAAAASFVALCSLAGGVLGAVLPRRAAAALVQSVAALFLVGSSLLALSRSAALVVNYGAPLHIYQHLPTVEGTGPPISVCTGVEWHRFPSAFFLPGQRYRLQFIKSGFDGLLPHQFNDSQGGTRAAPPYFNDRNQEEPANYWPSASGCDYVVSLRDEEGALLDTLAAEGEEGAHAWTQVASLPFVDQARSPPLFRAFYLPGLSAQRNQRYEYVLLRRERGSGARRAGA
jgi:alpha-1,2-mannosyltransferase